MPWLDCHDLDSTLSSLAYAIGTTTLELEWALQEYDEARYEDATEDPWQLMPRDVLDRFGTDVETVAGRFDGAYYFHGTRALVPEEFGQRGILPLGQMLDELWDGLRELVRDEIGDEGWAAFRTGVETGAGRTGHLYRHKVGAGVDEGPFALVVRDVLLNPESTGSHDYLGCPEIVQDIAGPFASAHGINLAQRFCDATQPCTVKFRSTQLRQGAINAALWYAYTKLRDGEITRSSNYSFDGAGQAVPAQAVVEVEVVTP